MTIHFQCPSCGNFTQAAPEYAGHTVPCTACGKPAVVPLVPRTSSVGLVLAIVFGVLFVIVAASGAALYFAVGAARDAAQQASCKQNLKELGLALHNYRDRHKTFPPAYICDASGKPLHSWRVLILPLIQEENLYRQIRLDEPWDSAHNRRFHDQMPPVFNCPSDDDPLDGYTNYMAVVDVAAGPQGGTMFRPGQFHGHPVYQRGIGVAPDGDSQTIMLVEVANSTTNWMEPKDLDLADQVSINGCQDGSCLSSEHKNGVNVVLVDGSVHTLTDTSPEKLRQLFLRSDGFGR